MYFIHVCLIRFESHFSVECPKIIDNDCNIIVITVRNIIPAVPGLWKDPPIVGKENPQKIRLNESKIYLGVSISLLVEERIIFGLF